MQPFGQAHSILVLDKCRIHHDQDFQDIISGNGSRLEFLPPYSPHLNSVWTLHDKYKTMQFELMRSVMAGPFLLCALLVIS